MQQLDESLALAQTPNEEDSQNESPVMEILDPKKFLAQLSSPWPAPSP